MPVSKTLRNQFRSELVVTGSHRRVRREHAAFAHACGRVSKTDVLHFNDFAGQLKRQKGGVAFIHVEHCGLEA